MGRAPVLAGGIVFDALQESVTKLSQVLATVKVMQDLHPGRVADPVRRAGCIGALVVHYALNEKKFIDKVVQISRRVKKACFTGNDQLGNSGNRGSKHDSAP